MVAAAGSLILVIIVGLAGVVVPQVGGNAVAHARHVDLPGIKYPRIVLAHVQQLPVLFGVGARTVHKLDGVVALVAAVQVGHTATMLETCGHQARGLFAGCEQAHSAQRVVVGHVTLHLHHGQRGEVEREVRGVVVEVYERHGGVVLAVGHPQVHSGAVHLHVVDKCLYPRGSLQRHLRAIVVAPLFGGEWHEQPSVAGVSHRLNAVESQLRHGGQPRNEHDSGCGKPHECVLGWKVRHY